MKEQEKRIIEAKQQPFATEFGIAMMNFASGEFETQGEASKAIQEITDDLYETALLLDKLLGKNQ